MRRAALLAFVLGLAGASGLVARAGDAPAPAAPAAAPKPATSERPAGTAIPGGRAWKDVVYGKVGDRPLLLDLYVPEPAPKKPVPVIVWVHGGGWVGGSKDFCPTLGMLALGFATASVEYRLATVAPFPAQIEDVKASVRWLRAKAGVYGLDPDRIGAAGASAGGHLVALLGTSGGEKDLEGTAGNPEQSSRVQAVCDLCGPTDLTQFDGHGSVIVAKAKDSLVAILLGGPLDERLDLARRANPITFVSKDDPPFLLIHGDKDNVVPIEQSKLLDAALTKGGVASTFVTVRGAGHGVGGPEVNRQMVEFFRLHLGTARKPSKALSGPASPPAPDAVPPTSSPGGAK